VVRLFTRKGDERSGDFAESAEEVRAFALAYKDRNVYVAPNPTNSTLGARHTAAEVTHWSYFLIDMDPVEEQFNAENALSVALLWFGEWMGWDFDAHKGMRPIIIDSGRGMQAWIRLEDIALDDVTVNIGISTQRRVFLSRMVARRANGYWLKKLDEKLGVCHGCRIDTSVSDLPRVMRCPGTVNVKTGRTAEFVHATDYVFKGLAELIVSGTPSAALTDPEPPTDLEAGLPWQEVFPHLTRMAQTYLSQGQEEPGRHKVMWHTAKKLHELGVTRQEARKALRWANALKGEDAALPPDQVKHALDTAYGNVV